MGKFIPPRHHTMSPITNFSTVRKRKPELWARNYLEEAAKKPPHLCSVFHLLSSESFSRHYMAFSYLGCTHSLYIFSLVEKLSRSVSLCVADI
jgi:hypothetical protein